MKIILIIVWLCTLFVSDSDAHWVAVPAPSYNKGIAATEEYLFTCTERNIQRSSDNGEHWEDCCNNAPCEQSGLTMSGLYSYGRIMLVVMFDGFSLRTYRSTNEGNTWERAKLSGWLTDLCASKNSFFSLFYGHTIIRSPDSTVNWDYSDSGVVPFLFGDKHPLCYTLTIANGILYCARHDGPIFRSIDDGLYWSQVSSRFSYGGSENLKLKAINESTLLAFMKDTIFRSTNSGVNWTSVNIGFITNTSIVDGNNVFVGGNHGVLLSTDQGISWRSISDGILDSTSIKFLTIHHHYLFVGDLWRRPISDFYSSVFKNESAEKPNLTISFSPSTNKLTIKYYYIQQPSTPKLEIYDLLGRLMLSKSITSASQGWNSFDCDAHEIKNGSYVCRLSFDGFILSKNLLVVK